MSSSEDEIRLWVERQFDEFYNDLDSWVKSTNEYFTDAVIDPNLETMLSFMVGLTYGVVVEGFNERHNRSLSPEENEKVRELIKRRIFELRMNLENYLHK